MKFFGGSAGHPKFRANVDATVYGDDTMCCAYCGKLAKRAAHFVYLNGLGEPVAPTAERDDRDDLGYCQLGADCARKAKAAGVVVYERGTSGYQTAV
jgi:hypothetical protein